MNAKRVTAASGVIHAAQKSRQTAAGIAASLEAAGLLQSPESAAELVALRARVDEVERAYTFDTAALKKRVAELEKQAAVVTEFTAQRAEYVTSLRNCHPDNGHDYDRWQGHAAARRQLSERLGLPVAWPAEADPSPVAAPVEDPHDSPLHHAYQLGRDLDRTVEDLAAEGAESALLAKILHPDEDETPNTDSAEPNGCGVCGLPGPHGWQWVAGPGLHQWQAPTDAQIKARMLARRSARLSGGAS